MLRYNRQLDLV